LRGCQPWIDTEAERREERRSSLQLLRSQLGRESLVVFDLIRSFDLLQTPEDPIAVRQSGPGQDAVEKADAGSRRKLPKRPKRRLRGRTKKGARTTRLGSY
jgi:hypothetical protein